jgi:hypothetical protein
MLPASLGGMAGLAGHERGEAGMRGGVCRGFAALPVRLRFRATLLQPKTEKPEPKSTPKPPSTAKASKNVSMLSFTGGDSEEAEEAEQEDG